ncbi:uncharacterized protein LOC135611596 [Musa acuminata AAA Group]|uniref:uncharacterized protein LOC135611596 n=1 Tax=Musa acuminata AAA Group TaxID=214697 RepID=UPI0031CF95E3
MHLMNPLTGAQFPLPPVTTLPFVAAVRDSQGRVTGFILNRERRADGTAIDRRPPHTYSLPDAHRVMFHKAILSAAPDEGSGFVVMMICNIWRASAFARAEDKAWTYIDTPVSGTVGAWEPHGLSFKPKVIPVDLEGEELLGYTMYLVESLDGSLMLVCRDRELVGMGPELIKTSMFLKEQELEWKKLKSLHEQTLFLGGVTNHSMCMSTIDFPELEWNRIDDDFRWSEQLRHQRHDIGIFYMMVAVISCQLRNIAEAEQYEVADHENLS